MAATCEISTWGYSLLLLLICNSGHVPAFRNCFHTQAVIPKQMQALSALYQATSGAKWRNNTLWMVPGTGYCLWHGVCCAPNGEVQGLVLRSNSLRGTIPRKLGELSKVKLVGLNSNALSGVIPEQLSSLTDLTEVALYDNLLSGTVPDGFFRIKPLHRLGMWSNSLSGTVPNTFHDHKYLNRLGLANNSFSGTIPKELIALPTLEILDLHQNSFSGTIPSVTPSLMQLLLASNDLSGTVPDLFQNRVMNVLALASNGLSGTLPDTISTSSELKVLTLHHNRFHGPTPTFARLQHLRALTLFRNSLGGRLILPSNATLQTLVVHGNYMSCQIGQSQTKVHQPNLVLPGNTFSAPIPDWVQTRQVQFLFYTSWWQSWHFPMIVTAFGLVGLAAVLLSAHMSGTLRLDPHPPGVVEIRRWCAKGLFGWSLVLPVILPIIYYHAANLYECGKPWLRLTAGYVHQDAPAELALAVIASCSFGLAAFCLQLLSQRIERTYLPVKSASWSTRSKVVLWVAWVPASIVLSTPIALYVVSTSLPPENTWNLSPTVLLLFQHTAAPGLYCVSALLVPPLARRAVRVVHGAKDPTIAAHLMIFARLMVILIVPFGMVLMLDQHCFALWLQFWEPCQRNDQFDLSIGVPIHSNLVDIHSRVQLSVTSQDEVCEPGYKADDCPRGLLETVGQLVLEKLVFAAFIGPLSVFVRQSEHGQRVQEWVMRKVLRRSDYQASLKLDTEVVGVVMILEIVLVYGFSIPLLIPLAAITFGLNTFMFQLCLNRPGVSFISESAPPVGYLWWSLGLGAGLMLWLFVECGWTGMLIAVLGVPLGCIIGGRATIPHKQSSDDKHSSELLVGLTEASAEYTISL